MRNKKTFGKWGEQKAEEYLLSKGFTILSKNFYTRYGEVDLIAQEGAEIVFIEVKTRSSADFGYPEESVTEKKLSRLVQAAQVYLHQTEKENFPWRVDVISITSGPSIATGVELVHLEDVIH